MSEIVSTSKARQFYEVLKAEITGGKYAGGARLPSIRDLAEQYSLSKNTVSTVIAVLVNEGLAVIHEGTGTFVSSSHRRMKMIGMLLFDFRQNMRVDTDILWEIQLNLPRDYYLSMMDTSDQYDVFCEALGRLRAMKPDSFFILPPKVLPTPGEVQRVQELLEGIPTVFLNRIPEGIEADMYSMDLGRGIEKAFEYLALLGKQRTAIVLHDDYKFQREELEAYRRYQKDMGFPLCAELEIEWKRDQEALEKQVERLLPQIDSLIAPDEALLRLQPLIHASGRKIPAQPSLIGINDTINSRLFNPPLTSIVFPVERIGRHAVNKLIRRIEGSCAQPYRQVHFEPELIVRKT